MIETLVKRTINPKWKFTHSGQVGLYIEKGLSDLPALFGIEAIEESRIVDYVVYQIYRYRTSLQEDSWDYRWLFSKSAFEKYKKQFLSADGKSGMNYYINQWLDEAELSREKLTCMIKKRGQSPLKSMIYLESEEPIKRRFLNSEEGLALCQQATTGWSPFSYTCNQCDNWVQCEKITANKFPELVRFRKDEYKNGKKK